MSQAALPGQTKPPPLKQPVPLSGGVLLVVALFLAVIAAVINLVYIEMIKQQVAQDSIPVYVLNRPVRAGDRFADRDIETVRVPESFEPAFNQLGAVLSEDGIRSKVGTPFMRSASENQLITYELFDRRDDADDRILPPEGMAAINLPVDGRNQPGNLRPGMFVDIVAPFQTTGQIPEMITVMERVQVAALDRHLASDADDPRARTVGNYRSITVNVNPEVGKRLLEVQQLSTGQFHLFVRAQSESVTPKIAPGQINERVLEMLKTRMRG